MRAFLFGRGITQDTDPNVPPQPIGVPVNFATSNFSGFIPTCSSIATIYSTSTRLERNVIDWLKSRTQNVPGLAYMGYMVTEGSLNIPPNGYYRFEDGRNIIRLQSGVVQEVIYCP